LNYFQISLQSCFKSKPVHSNISFLCSPSCLLLLKMIIVDLVTIFFWNIFRLQ
jgi:hypothetical protein